MKFPPMMRNLQKRGEIIVTLTIMTNCYDNGDDNYDNCNDNGDGDANYENYDNHEWRSVTWVVSGLLLVIIEVLLGLHRACWTNACRQ